VIHVPKEEHSTVISEFHRVLRPGGELLVSMGAIEGWEGRNDGWLDTDTAMEWSYYGPRRAATSFSTPASKSSTSTSPGGV